MWTGEGYGVSQSILERDRGSQYGLGRGWGLPEWTGKGLRFLVHTRKGLCAPSMDWGAPSMDWKGVVVWEGAVRGGLVPQPGRGLEGPALGSSQCPQVPLLPALAEAAPSSPPPHSSQLPQFLHSASLFFPVSHFSPVAACVCRETAPSLSHLPFALPSPPQLTQFPQPPPSYPSSPSQFLPARR